MSTGKMSTVLTVSHQSFVTLTLYTKQQTLFSTEPANLSEVIVVSIDILPNWGLFGIIKKICHASVGILIECLPSGGWFSLFTFVIDKVTFVRQK